MQGGGGGGGETELVSRTLQIEQKLFYLDLKDNARGRFLKISERTNAGRSTIIVPLAGVVWFVDLFNYYANGHDDANGGELSSKELQLDTKVFYFDVGENPRGRFLKVTEAAGMVRGANRSSIIVPAGVTRDQGWAAFRNVLVEIHEASLALPPALGQVDPAAAAAAAVSQMSLGGAQTGGAPVAPVLMQQVPGAAATYLPDAVSAGGAAPPAGGVAAGDAGGAVQQQQVPAAAGAPGGPGSTLSSRVIRADPKRFFMDLGSNQRGYFLKISEVLGQDRSYVIIPAQALEQVHETLGSFLELLRAQQGGQQQAGYVRNVPSVNRTQPGS